MASHYHLLCGIFLKFPTDINYFFYFHYCRKLMITKSMNLTMKKANMDRDSNLVPPDGRH